ncbi:MAG TPA: hypothetical protein VK167_15220 [Flavipsychrobacter sp.]|nr:hypothetical protein [Flavipsychrobacter sp.]
MKKTATLLLAIAGFSAHSIAQDNRAFLRVNSFSGLYSKHTNNTTKGTNKNFHVLPSVGYAHVFKNNIGIGAEFGFTNKAPKTDVVTNANQWVTTEEKRSDGYSSYFVGLSVFETIKLKKYVANLGLLLPMEFIKSRSSDAEFVQKNSSTNRVTKQISTQTYPGQFISGLYMQAALYRQVIKKLYIGAEIGAGVSYVRTSGENKQLTESYDNGEMTESRTVKYNVKDNSYNMGLRTTFSVQYIF